MIRPSREPAQKEEQQASSVHVRLFSVLREAVGQTEIRLPLAEPVRGDVLLNRLADAYPVLERYRQNVRLAVGERYVNEEATVRPGDDVALITPVSGG